MDKQELQKQMKYHLDEYTKLKSELEILTRTDRLSKVESMQRSYLNLFKERYTVTAPLDADTTVIDFADVESKLLSAENIESLVSLSEGYSLTYNNVGMPGLLLVSRTESNFIPFAVDERDASLYKEREARRIKMSNAARTR